MRFHPICEPPVRSLSMLDVLFIAAGCALVAIAIAYTYACERL
jgi:hypothetical protein